MVQVGEESGALAKVLNDLSDLLEHEDEVRGEIVSAVAYPVFVLVLGIVTGSVLLLFVLPRLFAKQAIGLGKVTRALADPPFEFNQGLLHRLPFLLFALSRKPVTLQVRSRNNQ